MKEQHSNLPYPETSRAAVHEKSVCAADGAPPDSSRQTLRVEGPLAIPRAHSARSHGHDEGRKAPGIEDAGAERPTELVLEGRLATGSSSVGWSLRDDPCPLESANAFDRTTGEIVWRPTCKNARCRRCSRQVSAQTFALARKALEPLEHVRFITLTQVPEGWEETRQSIKSWLLHLRREGVEMNALTVVERGEENGMKHVHAVQWGDFIPKDLLDQSWPHGYNEIEAARAATDYLAKGVLKYVAKGIDGDGEQIEEHMNLNGGRAAHWTRGFFAGKSRDGYRKDNPLPGIYFIGSDMPDWREKTPF